MGQLRHCALFGQCRGSRSAELSLVMLCADLGPSLTYEGLMLSRIAAVVVASSSAGLNCTSSVPASAAGT